jgi:E3 ubiquitin-protein ligase BAH
MKFGKTYSEYVEKNGRNRLSGCSYVEFKRLKKLLKKCPLHDTHTAGGVTGCTYMHKVTRGRMLGFCSNSI